MRDLEKKAADLATAIYDRMFTERGVSFSDEMVPFIASQLVEFARNERREERERVATMLDEHKRFGSPCCQCPEDYAKRLRASEVE